MVVAEKQVYQKEVQAKHFRSLQRFARHWSLFNKSLPIPPRRAGLGFPGGGGCRGPCIVSVAEGLVCHIVWIFTGPEP